MRNLKKVGFVAVAMALLISCTENKTNSSQQNGSEQKEIATSTTNTNSMKGQQVPNNKVCMVNNAYMGKDQIEVSFEGKKYYGCCEMCKEKIPMDEKVRYATDPFSLKKISKADAYIVVIGDNNEVAYFENEANFQSFLKEKP